MCLCGTRVWVGDGVPDTYRWSAPGGVHVTRPSVLGRVYCEQHWKREPVEYNRYSTVKSGIAAVEYGSVRGIHSDPRGIAMLFHGSTRGIAMLFHRTPRISREPAIPRMLFHGCYSTLPYLKNHSFGRTHETATVLRGGGVSGGGKRHTRKAYRDWFKVVGLKLVGSIDEARHTCLVVLWPKGHGPQRDQQ